MVGKLIKNIDLHIAARTHFQMNTVRFQMFDELRIFDAANPMTDARRVKIFECFPNTFRAAGFSGVGGAGNIVISGIAKCREMRVNGISPFPGFALR